MISSVTKSTISILSTSVITGSLALIGILLLLILLIKKEILSASQQQRLEKLSKVLNIGIIPLLITFALIVVIRVIDLLK